MKQDKVLIIAIIVATISLIIGVVIGVYCQKNKINNNNIKEVNSGISSDNNIQESAWSIDKLKELPLPEVTGGERGKLGIDKNINEDTIDEYLNRSDSVYRDMRMLKDPGNYEAIGGDSYLSGYVNGFEVIPLPYIMPVLNLPKEVGQTYTGDTLFSINSSGTYEANYEESMSILEKYFPKDKNIFLMCGGGGYAGMTKELLVSLGWNENKIYNVGGYWYYNGKNNVEVKTIDNGEIKYDFSKVKYHNIDFKQLHKISKLPIELDNIYYDWEEEKKNKGDAQYDEITDKIDQLSEEQRLTDEHDQRHDQIAIEMEKEFIKKAKMINQLIENKASFIVVFDEGEGACGSGTKTLYSFANDFAYENNIYMYTGNFVVFKNTRLYEIVKYAPAVVIVDKGKILAYTDKESDDFIKIYENKKDFYNWIKEYVKTEI